MLQVANGVVHSDSPSHEVLDIYEDRRAFESRHRLKRWNHFGRFKLRVGVGVWLSAGGMRKRFRRVNRRMCANPHIYTLYLDCQGSLHSLDCRRRLPVHPRVIHSWQRRYHQWSSETLRPWRTKYMRWRLLLTNPLTREFHEIEVPDVASRPRSYSSRSGPFPAVTILMESCTLGQVLNVVELKGIKVIFTALSVQGSWNYVHWLEELISMVL